MKPDIKKRWVEALRSGKYKQGKGYLERNGEFCCLGVLCAIAKEDGVCDADNLWEFPGESVRMWAGLNGGDPEVQIAEGKTSLAGFNDAGGTFEEIAAAIEEQL